MGRERYGVDKEAFEKLQMKYDTDQEVEVLRWISLTVKEPVFSVSDLRDGVVLCNLLNAIESGCVPPKKICQKPRHRLEEQANIIAYLEGCRTLGVPEQDLFQVKDLLDDECRYQVIVNIYAVGREAQVTPGFQGEMLGVKNSVTREMKAERQQKKEQEHEAQKKRAGEERERGKLRRMESEKLSCLAVETDTSRAQKRAQMRHAGRMDIRKSLKIEFDPVCPKVMERGDADVIRYGFDQEAHDRIRAKQNFELEWEVCDWLELLNKVAIDDFYTSLRSGVLLCETVNIIRPGTVKKINKKNMAMLEQENIRSFIRACKMFGMLDVELFTEKDLHCALNLPQAATCIHAFARRVCLNKNYKGPKVEGLELGVPHSSKSPERDEEDPLLPTSAMGGSRLACCNTLCAIM
uniref:Calponin-homology (CH) domain-containing protein n=1 Tax=Paramoeba aestuarina TaxID=180227 RepID=A0A7S4NN09_9EUKA|eukprot:CAMPEP_0201514312 /NCGR_PEP_ID=MMETSP0161_2-20130828/6184_1 /ASSEMBLY_ACC=CAM_ASM_000251 /TAXON_ID=180227 /ORGANISM="Neoparamoeba aestuarina, Strain SoJaBio B1-5/56/2" /LENGTH=407 /DNA_ID=CAMNT_0047910837 /DNA_START=132 /DNA_END=1355 /DNA_ORIENTATION=+